MSMAEWHAYENSVRWRVSASGVEIAGSGVERTRGEPVTVRRVWERWHDPINTMARRYRVPCHLIVATICTESSGREDAVRREPGYVSDQQTPHRISAGLMQTLLSTAREAMQASFGLDWLLQGANSIEAGTAYIAKQSRRTNLDPPLVAAAYNAGRLKHQDGERNRWKLRQYPIGTGAHCDRFVRWFNDVVAVLDAHPVQPVLGLSALVDVSAPAPRRSPPVQVRADAISFADTARPDAVSEYSRGVLRDILRAAGLSSARISSTSRTPRDQARVMFNNLEQHGVAAQRRLYKTPGNRIIDAYVAARKLGRSDDETKLAMETAIKTIGPATVSRHCADARKLNVFDVGPKSISDVVAFERAVKAERRVAKFLTPPGDPGYHLEIPQPQDA